MANIVGKILSVPTERLETTMAVKAAIKKDHEAHASGGFGDIFKVLVPWRGLAAVKRAILRPQSMGKDMQVLLRETRLLPTLQHPNIIRIVCGLHNVPTFGSGMVLVWAENGSLTSYLKKNQDTERLPLLRDVAQGIEYLHTLDPPVVHGDLCCDNVLVSETGSALLTDFGLSGRVSGNDAPISDFDDMVVRPRYSAPELFGNDEDISRSPATDVFAFGMVVVEAYTGEPPFPHLTGSTSHAKIIAAIVAGERPKRTEITRDDFPDYLWDLIEECWASDPDERPSISLVRRRL